MGTRAAHRGAGMLDKIVKCGCNGSRQFNTNLIEVVKKGGGEDELLWSVYCVCASATGLR